MKTAYPAVHPLGGLEFPGGAQGDPYTPAGRREHPSSLGALGRIAAGRHTRILQGWRLTAGGIPSRLLADVRLR